MIKRLLGLKETPRLRDILRIIGGRSARKVGGIRNADGTPVSLEVIQREFGVSLAQAISIYMKVNR